MISIANARPKNEHLWPDQKRKKKKFLAGKDDRLLNIRQKIVNGIANAGLNREMGLRMKKV